MIKSLAKWGVKKYVLALINDILAANRENVAKARAIVGICITKAKALLKFLESLDAKLADNVLTDKESDEIVAESQGLVKELTA